MRELDEATIQQNAGRLAIVFANSDIWTLASTPVDITENFPQANVRVVSESHVFLGSKSGCKFMSNLITDKLTENETIFDLD